jgi:hypothetical protein
MNKTLIATLSFTAGKTDRDRELTVLDLRRECAGMARDAVKALLLPDWTKGAGIQMTEYRGAPAWPENAGTAKKRFNRLIADVCEGAAPRSKAEAEKPEVDQRVDQRLIDALQAVLAAHKATKKQAQSACASAIHAAFAE